MARGPTVETWPGDILAIDGQRNLTVQGAVMRGAGEREKEWEREEGRETGRQAELVRCWVTELIARVQHFTEAFCY